MTYRTFILVDTEENAIQLQDASALLLEAVVASAFYCLFLCMENAACFKSVFVGPTQCFIYRFIKDSQIPLPAGASLMKSEACYTAEKDMGEITLYLEKKNRKDAEAACAAKNGRLAMPKTQQSFQLMTNLATKNKLKTGPFIWIGMRDPYDEGFIYSDGEYIGDNGYHIPIEPAYFRADGHEEAIIFLIDSAKDTWVVGDLSYLDILPYFCQSA